MLVDALAQTASRFPDQEGLVFGDLRVTWSELYRRVLSIAGGLAGRGIGPGDAVGLWLDNGPCFVLAYFAVLARGAVVVPIDPTTQAGDLSLRGVDLKAIVTSPTLLPRCRRAVDASGTAGAPDHVLGTDSDGRDAWPDLDLDAPQDGVARAAGDPALYQFSSGSTGRPKGLVRTHGQCLAEVELFRATCAMRETDRVFGALPLFHSHGMFNSLWAAVGSGAALVLMPAPQPFQLRQAAALSLLVDERITVFPAVPLMIEALADGPATADLSRVRLCFTAGNALPKDVFDRFHNRFAVPVRQLYGCTEAGAVTINVDTDPRVSATTVGRPLHGVTVEIRGENNEPLPPDTPGEIAFRVSGQKFLRIGTKVFANGLENPLNFQAETARKLSPLSVSNRPRLYPRFRPHGALYAGSS